MGNDGNTLIEQTDRFLPTLQSEVQNKIVNIRVLMLLLMQMWLIYTGWKQNV